MKKLAMFILTLGVLTTVPACKWYKKDKDKKEKTHKEKPMKEKKEKKSKKSY